MITLDTLFSMIIKTLLFQPFPLHLLVQATNPFPHLNSLFLLALSIYILILFLLPYAKVEKEIMELGLTLGDSSKPLIGLMEKHPHQGSKELGLGFNTTLSIGPNITSQIDQLQQEEQNTRTENLHQLDLLPQLSFRWNPPSQNGNNPLIKKLYFSFPLIFSHS